MEPETNPPSTPQTIQQPPIQSAAPVKHKSSMLLWLFIIALAGIALYFGYQNWQLRQQVSQNQPTPTSNITPTITPGPTETWKTYTNTKFNYSVNYPNTGVARINCENEENMFYLVLGSQQDMLAPQNCARDSRFNIEIVASNKQLKNSDDRYQSTSSDYQIAGIQAVKYVYTQKPNFEGPGESWFEDIYFEKNGIYYDAYNQNKELSTTLDHILSTFRFTNQSQISKTDKQIGYIKSITPNYDNYKFALDYVDFVNSNTAPNGYKTENPSTETTTLYTDVPGTEPEVIMQTYSKAADGNFHSNQKITFSQFLEAFNSGSPIKNSLYWIEENNGTITKITEQYQP